MGLFAKLFDWGNQAARTQALKLGVSVAEVRRDLPFFSYSNEFISLDPGKCAKYSISRKAGSQPPSWSFLQRDLKAGAQYPNGWFYVSEHGSAPASLDQVLRRIADEWDEELLEFEATSSEIAAFWEEWGGVRMVERVSGYLLELART